MGHRIVDCVAWSPAGERYALVADKTTLLVHSMESDEPIGRAILPCRVNGISFVSDGIVACAGDDAKIRFCGLDGSVLTELDNSSAGGRVRTLDAIRAENVQVLAAGFSTGEVVLWALDTSSEGSAPSVVSTLHLKDRSGSHLTCMSLSHVRSAQPKAKAPRHDDHSDTTKRQTVDTSTPKKRARFDMSANEVYEVPSAVDAKEEDGNPNKSKRKRRVRRKRRRRRVA